MMGLVFKGEGTIRQDGSALTIQLEDGYSGELPKAGGESVWLSVYDSHPMLGGLEFAAHGATEDYCDRLLSELANIRDLLLGVEHDEIWYEWLSPTVASPFEISGLAKARIEHLKSLLAKTE